MKEEMQAITTEQWKMRYWTESPVSDRKDPGNMENRG